MNLGLRALGKPDGTQYIEAMRRAFSAWAAAAIVEVFGLGVLLVLAPETGEDELGQILRSHLPWILVSLIATLVCAVYCRSRWTVPARAAVAAFVPLMAVILSTALEFPRALSGAGEVLHITEGLFGIAIALGLVRGTVHVEPIPSVPASLNVSNEEWRALYGEGWSPSQPGGTAGSESEPRPREPEGD